jgi:hypothetical protein
MTASDVKRIKEQWHDSLRVETDTDEPGILWLAVCDDQSDQWARLPIGTGDVPEVVGLLRAESARAQQALEAQRAQSDLN